MYKIKKYEDVIPGFSQTIQKRFDMVKKLSRNFTQSNKTALEMDKLLVLQIEQVKKEKPKSSSNGMERKARDAAKLLIEEDVTAGRTVNQIKASQSGFSDEETEVRISKGKIHVTMLEGEKINYSFPIQSIFNEIMEETGREFPVKKKESKSRQVEFNRSGRVKINFDEARQVEKIDEEVKFIKRYISMHKKRMKISQVLNFLNALQRSILERRIRKESPYADEVRYMQTNLISLYTHMKKSRKKEMEVELDKKILKNFSDIAGSEKVRVSTNFLKRYVGIQEKEIDREKAQKLMSAMEKAAKSDKVPKDDPYRERMNTVYSSLRRFVNNAKRGDKLSIHENALNGIEGLIGCLDDKDCGCSDEVQSLRGIEPTPTKPEPKPNRNLMNSMDFAKLEFETLGFMGKWLDLIGDPAQGFTAMVYGRPKMGKSFLCIDFAGYLARHHGRTLYVAKEEKLDKTLQDKLNSKEVKHPMLDVSDYLPEDLGYYDFIILDSVNTLNLAPEDLRELKEQYPDKSFIYIFQTTKEGNFRGANTFQHDVDVVIDIPERGKAVQFGRFNQGGEMPIFNDAKTESLSGLDGKSKNPRLSDWTEPKELQDWEWNKLKTIKKFVDKKQYREAMDYAMYNCDTAIREAIPPEIWLKMGGKLTESGYEKLMKSGKKVPGLYRDKFGMWSVSNDE